MNQTSSWEVSFSDLFLYVLQGWRMLLIFLVIGAIAVGGYSFIKQERSNPADADPQILQQSREEYLARRLTPAQKRQVELVAAQIRLQEDRMQENIDYTTSSYYMDIDTFQMDSCDMQYYILPEKEEIQTHELAAFVTAYASVIENRLNQEGLRELLSDTEDYINTSGLLDCILEDREDGILGIRINARNEAERDLIMNEVQDLMRESSADIGELLGDHKVIYLGTDVDQSVNRNIRQDQNAIIAILKDLQAQINAARASLAGVEETEYLDFLLSQTEEAQEIMPDASVAVQTSASGISVRETVKYAVIGALLGLIVAVILRIIRYVSGSRIRRAADLERLTGTRTLGCFAGDSPWTKKHHAAPDRWLLKQRNKKHPVKEYQEAVASTASNLKLIAGKNQIQAVAILAAGMEVSCLVQDLQKKLEKTLLIEGVQLQEADGVVLIVQQDVSSLNSVYDILGLCRQCGLPVIGSIMIV